MKIEKIRKDIVDILNQNIWDIMEEEGVSGSFDKNEFVVYGDVVNGEKSIEEIDIFVKLEVDLYGSDEKYKIFEFSDLESNFYDGEHKAIEYLNEAIKEELNYKGVPLNVKFSLEEFEDVMLLQEGCNLKSFIDVLEMKEEKALLKYLENDSTPNVVNSIEVRELFAELGHKQRNEPEIQMLSCQRKMGGGVLSHMIEHIGDLTHRMSESIFSSTGDLSGTLEYVSPKVKRGLIALKNEYGFGREHNDNMINNYNVDFQNGKTTLSFEDWNKEVNDMLNEYSNKHSELTVYNKAQYSAREAAVELGRLNFDKVIEHLEYLDEIIENGEYLSSISEYKEGGYQPEQKIKKAKKNKLK